jgi:REP element-mobilizing transposase RayT
LVSLLPFASLSELEIAMPRKRFFPTDQFPYHVTARSQDREWFDLPMIEVWDIFSRYLYFVTLAYGVRIHSFVLMSNHFHLLISTPNANLDKAMTYLMREVNGAIHLQSERKDQVFEESYHWTVIKNRVHYQHVYKYVYRNPVEARICSRVESYPYSTLRGILGLEHLPFSAFDNMNLISHPGEKLSWLNAPFPEVGFREEICRALKKREFSFQEDEQSSQLSLFSQNSSVPLQ